MRLNSESVLEKFRLYSGEDDTDPARWALCQALCSECQEQVEDQAAPLLQKGQPRLEALAAAMALHQLALADGMKCPESITAPELKLELGARADKAAGLVQEKRQACAGLLQEGLFDFRGV